MEWHLIPWVGLILAFAGCVQASVGFAFALFSIPMIVALGVPLPQAVAMGSLSSMAMSAGASWSLRSHIPWRDVAPLACLTAVTVPLGIYIQSLLMETSTATIKQVLGLIILVILIAQFAFRIKPREHVHWIWGVLAMFCCGTLSGICGMGGPPVVLWVMAHTWSNERSRGTLLATFAILGPSTLLALIIKWQGFVLPAVGFGIMLIPISLMGMLIGLAIGKRISKDRLRWIALALLTFIAVGALLSPYLT